MRRFSVLQVKSIVFQLLQVLEYLHSHPSNFVHRDLKCANLLLGDDNVLKLADFGLARSLVHNDPLGRLSPTVVTLWYRAPELLLGAVDYTAAVDMWSVGCIVAELLLHEPLFRAKVEQEQVSNIFSLLGSPPPDSKLRCLPWWERYTVEERKPQLEAFLSRSPRTADPDLQYLLSRLLRLDPTQRMSAREALAARWFTTPPAIDRSNPVAG